MFGTERRISDESRQGGEEGREEWNKYIRFLLWEEDIVFTTKEIVHKLKHTWLKSLLVTDNLDNGETVQLSMKL